ncbi:peptide deformylase [uncultured Acetobacteroides sp.]|uniref:peptide deformylase n=1 Tax=uncultured Acetobacteroides sp. TaxID=1760811 RepID=UPI0029F5C81A|nr:peptide deformylase [uncultured Acetobacteroides sp.]
MAVLPIVAYGSSILKKPCTEISSDSAELQQLIDDMWQTMYAAHGQGLAAPQVGRAIRLFTVDNAQVYRSMDESERRGYFDGDQGVKETFINATILSQSEQIWKDEEGCLSVPNLSGDVARPWRIEIAYYDRSFQQHRKTFSGVTARVIQHEYDHTQGVVYVDRLSALSRRLLGGKLRRIIKGMVKTSYPLTYIR